MPKTEAMCFEPFIYPLLSPNIYFNYILIRFETLTPGKIWPLIDGYIPYPHLSLGGADQIG